MRKYQPKEKEAKERESGEDIFFFAFQFLNLILNVFDDFQWAHFPPIQYKGDGESCGQEEENPTWNSEEATEVNSLKIVTGCVLCSH